MRPGRFGAKDPVLANRARALKSQGYSITEIAARLRVSRSAVGDWVVGMGVQAIYYAPCLNCGEQTRSYSHRRLFCDKQCMYDYHKKPLLIQSCLNCGESFFERRERRYCNYRCAYEYREYRKPQPILYIELPPREGV